MKVEILGVIHTEKGITIINPDNGLIVQQINAPIKPKSNIEKIKSMFPIDETEMVNKKESVNS
jgi:hypothetical protein